MRLERIPLAISLLAVSVMLIGLAPTAMAASCNAEAKVPATASIFVETSDRSTWHEYPNAADISEFDRDSDMSAEVWQLKNKIRSVDFVEQGQDFTILTRYCFNEGGQLEDLGFELRTELGWGVRAQGSGSRAGFDARALEFFSLKDGKTIPRPDGVAEIPASLKPAMYQNVSDLPFASSLPVFAERSRRKGVVFVSERAGN